MSSAQSTLPIRTAITREYIKRYAFVVVGLAVTTLGGTRAVQLFTPASLARRASQVLQELVIWGSLTLAGIVLILIGVTAIIQQAVADGNTR